MVNISARQGDHEYYINRNIRISSNEILSENELADRAARVASGLIDSQAEFKVCDHAQIVGIAIAGAYERDLN